LLPSRVQEKEIEIVEISAHKPNLFPPTCDSKDLTKALYEISNLLDPNIKAYSNDELIKQAIAILSEDCCFAVHTTKAKNSS